jgi:hypothetical protein
MAEVVPYQFEPVYNPGEPVEERDSSSSDDESPSVHGRREDNELSWCSCGKCARMDKEVECLCCREMAQVNSNLQGSGKACITELPDFQSVCLDPNVLETVLVGMVEMGYQPLPPTPIPNRYVSLAKFLHGSITQPLHSIFLHADPSG